jgi:hypothetical protein
MVHAFVAYTDEIDDVDVAVAAIREQSGANCPEGNHTLGILTCHPEFVHSGVAAAVVAAMPFQVVGMTTSCMGVGPMPAEDQERGEGALRLTLMVLWGEDLRFDVVGSGALPQTVDETALVQTMLAGREAPTMLLVFAPDYSTVSCDALLSAVSETMPDVPLFGGVGVDDSALYNEDCYAITPEGPAQNALVMVLVYGDVIPAYFTASVTPNRVMGDVWRATDAAGSSLRAVNDRPVSEFLESFGLTHSLAQDGALSSLSLVVKEPLKPPYSRTMLALSPDGALRCGGQMPCDCDIRLARFEKGDMLLAAQTLLGNVPCTPKRPSALLVLCCATRAAVLGDDTLAEVRLLRQAAGEIPFLLAYAGGEICPGTGDGGRMYNQFHNQSFTLCALY